MQMAHIRGADKGNIMLFALSTCVWCKKTKALLKELGIAYDYIDVDLLEGVEGNEVRSLLYEHNPEGSFRHW